MNGKAVGAIVSVLIIVGIVGVWYSSHSPTKPAQVNPKGAILARMGSMACYQYQENITTIEGNVTEHSAVEGGSSNGAYFFHGRKKGLEWWGVIRGKTLLEKVSSNGTVSHIKVNLTEGEIKDLLLYDPIKTGLRALGSASSVRVSGSWVASNYTIYITYKGSGALMTGTVRVFYGKDYTPEKIELTGKISNGREVLQEFSLSAKIIPSCGLPEWAKELEG